MDSTPPPVPVPVSIPITDHLNSSPSPHHPVSKLPVKRKIHISLPDSNSRRDGPTKFHRIWTEPDEILFLQSLINSPPLSFPRDLHIFYTRFLNNICRPYSKSQLSEKLRRLRKKWRVVSTRLSQGLELNRLSQHDRTLFELSEKLWHPDYAQTSPFGAPSGLITRKSSVVDGDVNDDDKNGGSGGGDCDKVEKCSVDDAKLEEEKSSDGGNGNEIEKIVAKTVVDVFDESVKFVKSGKRFCYGGGGGGEGQCESFDKRWRELRAVEMEVLAQRLRLVVEDSIMKR